MDREGVTEFVELDLSRMLENPRCAIHISTLEEAQIVIINAKNQFPERVKNWDAVINNHWKVYEEETGFTMFYENEDEPTTMSYEDISWFTKNGYQIVEFSELLGEVVDIEESEQSLDFLLN